jgi:hypothetical protein
MIERKPGPERTVLVATGKDGPQRIRVNRKWWTAEAEALFLDHLAASCNISWAAAQAGFSTQTLYRHRRTEPDFARRWDEALDVGYIRLKTELLGTAIGFVERLRTDPELPLKHMTVRDAVNLINRHGGGGGGTTARNGRFRPRPWPFDEARDSILAKLEAIEAARRLEAEGAADDQT